MAHMGTDLGQAGAPRVDWVDYAKGFCIIMVVMMHSTLGVEAAAGQTSWMHALVAFAKPFRMPDFFLISGLFLARVIDRDWRTYLDRKVMHFVYFYSGYLFAHHVFALSDHARARPALALAGLAAWALINGGLVVSGFSEWPLISLALGLAGACAIVTGGTLLARAHWLNFLRTCGEHSIVIYLAFFLPMAATRTLLLKTGLIADIGTISLVVTIAGIVGALVLWRVALAVGANFLFERPAAFWIAPKKPRATLQAAE